MYCQTAPHDMHGVTVHANHGYLLGLFPVNVLHNLVHILFGVLGVASAYGGWSRGYCQFVAIAYGLLAVLGLIPTANVNHTFGLIPIEGHDVWLHALIAIVAAIFGWGVAARTTTGTTDTAGAPRM